MNPAHTMIHRQVGQPLTFPLRDADTGICWWECDRETFHRRTQELTAKQQWGAEARRSSLVNQVSEPR